MLAFGVVKIQTTTEDIETEDGCESRKNDNSTKSVVVRVVVRSGKMLVSRFCNAPWASSKLNNRFCRVNRPTLQTYNCSNKQPKQAGYIS